MSVISSGVFFWRIIESNICQKQDFSELSWQCRQTSQNKTRTCLCRALAADQWLQLDYQLTGRPIFDVSEPLGKGACPLPRPAPCPKTKFLLSVIGHLRWKK